ncbi:hypothetical protein ACWET9_44185 [Streptomyces sp. NPDC004059]
MADIKRRYVKGNRWRPGNRLALAVEFGVSERSIRKIARGVTWETPIVRMPPRDGPAEMHPDCRNEILNWKDVAEGRS